MILFNDSKVVKLSAGAGAGKETQRALVQDPIT